jgi:hypothetical protein
VARLKFNQGTDPSGLADVGGIVRHVADLLEVCWDSPAASVHTTYRLSTLIHRLRLIAFHVEFPVDSDFQPAAEYLRGIG